MALSTAELVQEYCDASLLDARIALHQQYTKAEVPWFDWVWTQLTQHIPIQARVLEVGCGSSRLWQTQAEQIPSGWQITLADLSLGMLQETQAAVSGIIPLLGANIQYLPITDASMDAVIANHMLYHVADRSQAYREIKRVLRPNGVLLATTNGQQSMQIYDQLVKAAKANDLINRIVCIADVKQDTGFNLEHGLLELQTAFAQVECIYYQSAIVVDSPEPLVAYAEASSHLTGAGLERLRILIEQALAETGELRIEKYVGMFVAHAR